MYVFKEYTPLTVIVVAAEGSDAFGFFFKHYIGVFVCIHMYVCMVITYSRLWINRVRSPILLVVSWTGKMKVERE